MKCSLKYRLRRTTLMTQKYIDVHLFDQREYEKKVENHEFLSIDDIQNCVLHIRLPYYVDAAGNSDYEIVKNDATLLEKQQNKLNRLYVNRRYYKWQLFHNTITEEEKELFRDRLVNNITRANELHYKMFKMMNDYSQVALP